MQKQNRPLKAYLALGLGLTIIGFSAIFVRLADAPGIVTSFYRMLIGALIVTIPFARNIRKKKPLARKGVLLAILAGSFFGIDLAAWTSGVVLSGATLPTLFANTNPIWVGIGAWIIFKERLSAKFWIGLFIALSGAVLILGANMSVEGSINQGAILGLISGIFYGAYFLVAQRGRAWLDAISFFWIGTISSAFVLLIGSLILKQPLIGYSSNTWLIFLVQGLLIQGAGWFLISYAQGYLKASLVSPTLLGQPVLTAFLATFLLGESLLSSDIMGGIVILIGIFLIIGAEETKKSVEGN